MSTHPLPSFPTLIFFLILCCRLCSCLDGRTLEFYQWRDEVKELLDGARIKIDAMAKEWTPEEKEECVAETGRSFHYGGQLLSSITS